MFRTHLWCCRRFLPCSHPTCCVVSVTRRNTSVDESYEWDSVDPGVDAEVLEAMSCDRSPMGAGTDRGVFSYDQTHGPQDRKRQGEPHSASDPVVLLINRSPHSACECRASWCCCMSLCAVVGCEHCHVVVPHPCITSRSPLPQALHPHSARRPPTPAAATPTATP